ncbi:mutator 2 [Carabus blaptoides fortunei]
MTSTKHKVNMKRKQMGLLTIINKSYPIYEGLNVIGRDAKATVLLKDVKFSKQHAIITVVDESTHLLSDFGSSNGTRLGNKCLVPYQLYRVNNEERIIFSDVLGLYHKNPGSNKVLSNGNLSKINEELSETSTHDAETQILEVENKVLSNITCTDASKQDALAPTQQLFNIHEASTQIETSNISVCDNDDVVQATQVCDMPTQIVTANLSKQKQCPLLTQDEFSRTECYDDVFANESFRLSLNKHLTSAIEVDETVLIDKSNIAIESDNGKEVILNTHSLNQLNCVGAVTKAENPVKSVAEDDNKNSDDSNSGFEKRTKNINTNNDSGSETDMEINIMEDKQAKNKIDDSETDIDVEISKNKRKKLRKQRSTAKQISDDSETDIETSNVVKSSKKKVILVTSDSETDMDDKPLEIRKLATSANNESSATNNIINIIDSGSETEMEDENELLKMQNINSTTSVPIAEQGVKEAWSGSDDEIDLLAPVQTLSDSLTELNAPLDTSITNEAHQVKTSSDISLVQAELDVEDAFDDDDFDLLVPTQLLEIKSAEKNIADAPPQLVTNNEETLVNSLAPTQLLEPVTARKTDEEINSEAPTQLLEPGKISSRMNKDEEPPIQSLASTSKVNEEDDYLAPTQLIDPTVYAKVSNEENVELDSLAPTQLLQPERILPSTGIPNDEAETQIEDIPTRGNEENEDLAPTQLLKPLESSSKQNCEDEDELDYLAPTQKLQFNAKSGDNEANDDEEILENVPMKNLAMQSTPNGKKSCIKQVEREEHDEDFLVPTQKLSLAGKNVSFSEDIFTAPTQLLPGNEEHTIFSAPTQKLTPRKSLGMKRRPEENQDDDDDDFMAPTQLLTANKKTADGSVDLDFSVNDDPHYINIDYSSEDTSLRLAISYTDDSDFCAATQKLELPKNESIEKIHLAPNKLLSEPETQFEVQFDLETQKLYVEAATARPNNPLANMFGEENTQLTETEGQTPAELKTLKDSDQTMSSNVETSDSSFQEGSKKRSIEEDIGEVDNKRGRYVQLTKNEVDNVTNNTRRTSKRAETINSKYAKSNLNNKNENVTSSPKKRDKKVEETIVPDAFEEDTTSVPSTSNIKLTEKLSDDVGKVTEEKLLENKLPGTPRRMSRRGRVTEERELGTPRKTPARRVKKVVQREEQEPAMLKELMLSNKSPEVKVILTKVVSKEELEEKTKGEYKKPSDEHIVPKRQLRMTKKSETTVTNTVSTRVTRNKSNSNEESTDCKSSKENVSELDDFAVKTKKTRKTRGKQAKQTDDAADDEEKVVIEDSDDSTNSNIEKYIRHKVLKLEYTDESCSGSSAASFVAPRHNKRTLKIEDYSSDENSNKTENNQYVDTPNTKRRRYEPLNITAVTNGQTSNSDSEPIKHKIVFTMLNNPELETTVKSLGGTTIDSVYSCTALVTNKISRSLKFLIAVSLGKPIVNTKWISESVKKKMFLDPWNFLLEDSESESKFKFSLRESLQRARHKKLLAGYTILLAVNKNFDVLKEIIETCGGKCVMRAPAKNAAANVVVVAYEDEKAKYARYLKQKTPLTVVAAEAIFAGVLAQELNFENHLLL